MTCPASERLGGQERGGEGGIGGGRGTNANVRLGQPASIGSDEGPQVNFMAHYALVSGYWT